MDSTRADLDRIRAVVATVERTQRAELVDEFVDLFTADAIWTTATGVRLIGRDAIAEFTGRVLPGAMTDLQGTTYEVTHVAFLRPDIAAVQVRQTYADADGAPVADAVGAPLYVMVKDDERWLLAACQNTPVAEP
ncbi:SgcJ/EcaC family oxidoreductase [Luteipulveratus sp. YIM 133132]|uniref:SgcJ/EcaC family oxidoreductase n=1 Tax=Luteipulveratus flavus TaxID=3031728 RepID=UPI0023B13F37|nr:SgcJ/EcaC family oxidoreductase [Luteipulveratus sp. YIM 133132]MDE9365493.1 SgcJ/EcaC family oxidoreductase [Luteipulveratus sp. YIM 133132]